MSVCDNAAAKESLSALQPQEEYLCLSSGPLSLSPSSFFFSYKLSNYHTGMLDDYKTRLHAHVGNGVSRSAGSDNTGGTNRSKQI